MTTNQDFTSTKFQRGQKLSSDVSAISCPVNDSVSTSFSSPFLFFLSFPPQSFLTPSFLCLPFPLPSLFSPLVRPFPFILSSLFFLHFSLLQFHFFSLLRLNFFKAVATNASLSSPLNRKDTKIHYRTDSMFPTASKRAHTRRQSSKLLKRSQTTK